MNRGATGWLGFFFFVALVVVLYSTLIVGDIKLFHKPLPIQIRFPAAGGLRKGDDIRVDGMLFGKVKDIALHETGGVLVSGELDEAVTLYSDARIQVEPSSILGGTMVTIARGSAPPALDLGRPLEGHLRPGIEAIPEGFKRIEPSLTETIQEIRDLVRGVNEGRGTIGQLATSPRLHDELVATVQEARQVVSDARGAIARIKEVGETVQRSVEKIEKGDGPLPALLNDRRMSEKLKETLDAVHETAGSLRSAAEKINSGDGTLGRLLNDKEMGESLKGAVHSIGNSARSIEKIAERIEKGPGTINRLIQDPELYDRAKQTVEDLDKVVGKAARAVVEIVGESKYYGESDAQVSKIGLKIRLSDARDFKGEMLEDKYFLIGASFMHFSREGEIVYKNLVEKDEDETIIKADVQLAYRIPWFLDRRITARAGLIEGRPGGGVDVDWDDWLLFSWPVRFTVEARDAYNHLDDEDIDEGIDGPLVRAFVKAPIWTRKEGWLDRLLGTVRVYGGFSRIGEDPEYVVGIGLEWPDDDIRSLVALLGLAR